MILRKVGKYRGVGFDPRKFIVVNGVRRSFQKDVFDAAITHFGKILVEIDRIGGRQNAFRPIPADLVTESTYRPRGMPCKKKDLGQDLGHGSLSVGADDGDHLHIGGWVAVKIPCDHGKCRAGIVYDKLRQVAFDLLGRNESDGTPSLCFLGVVVSIDIFSQKAHKQRVLSDRPAVASDI